MIMKSSIEFLFQKRDLKEEIKKLDYKKIGTYIFLFFNFLILNLLSVSKITFSNVLFSSAWILFLISIIYLSKRKCLVYSLLNLLFLILYIVQYFHVIIMDVPFSISELFYASEGLEYIDYILTKIDLNFLCPIIAMLLCWIINSFFINKFLKKERGNFFIFLIILFLFVFLHQETILLLGKTGVNNSYHVSEKAKSIYDTFNDKKKVYQICGIYEYHIRDTYLFIKNNFFKLSLAEKQEVEEYIESNINEKNEYTGILKNKNLIVILAESIDDWLITEDVMPTVYKMREDSIDFTNRYAPSFGGGRTLNTEYCLNTGLYIPTDYVIHNSLNNYYGNSLPNVFNSYNYKTTSIHYNSGEFYNRNNLHQSLGYKNSYFLKDLYDEEYINDYEIINNENFYQFMISNNEKFMTFFITYSAHLPYNDSNKLCQDIENVDSISCIKKLAGYTDEAIGLLLEKLERDNLLDDTVIAFVTDHYAYGIDKEILSEVKGGLTTDYLEKVPFFIWGNNIEKQKIEKYVDTQDILPTLLNLFGMKSEDTYMGTDALSTNHKNFIYFNDRSYIGEVDKSTVEKMIRINDLIVKGNYHR